MLRTPPPQGGLRVWVSGGTGYIGRAVVAQLLQHGHGVTRLCHTPVPPLDGVRDVMGDVRMEGPWTASLKGHDAVIHLVGIIRERIGQGVTFQALHPGAARRVTVAAARAGVGHVVYVSALGVGRCPGTYMATKAEAEETVRQSGLAWTILRPSLVFGPGASFFELLRRLGRWPVVPVVGSGTTPFAPISLRDVARVAVASLTEPRARGRIYEMGGPEVLTYRELVDRLAGRPVAAVHLPKELMRRVAALLEGIPSFPLTVDQIRLLDCPSLPAEGTWTDHFGPPAERLSDWLAAEAARASPRGGRA